MLIRAEREGDHGAIAEVTRRAFAAAAHASGTEAEIISRLRDAGDLHLSLVAEEGTVVGHVAFSPVAIDGASGRCFALGPVSVIPDRQRRGIGAALIRTGLARLRADGAAGCVVLGDPAYYARFGFEHDPRLRYDHAPAEFFTRLGWEAGGSPTGRVDYPPAFSA